MSLGRSMVTVAVFTGLSRFLGFVRDVLMATVLGTGPLADAFFVAFKLPNLFRQIFAEGAFNAAFVPLFSKKLECEGQKSAQDFANRCLTILGVSLLTLTGLSIPVMPWLILILAPGFLIDSSGSYGDLWQAMPGIVLSPLGKSEKFDLAVFLGTITFPYLFFVSLVALLSGVMNSLQRFAVAAAAPVLLNVCLIVALVAVMPFFEDKAQVLAWAVVLAGFAQLIALLYAARRAGFIVRPICPRTDNDLKALFRRMGPGVLSAGAMQINVQVGTLIASLQAGAVSYLYYADRIYQLPLGVIGVALNVILLPELSRRLARADTKGALNSLNRGLEMSMALTLPATMALFAIPWAIVVTLFEQGAFGRDASDATAAALTAYATGLPAFVLMKIFQPAFFVRGDTSTPFRLALTSILVNILLAFFLSSLMGHVGIALATSLASWLNLSLLFWVLYRRGHYRPDARLLHRLSRIIAASLVMAALLWAGKRWLLPFLNGDFPENSLALLLLVVMGLVAYGGLILLMGGARLQDLKGLYEKNPVTDSKKETPSSSEA